MLILAGLGVAAAFAPAWDSFTLRTAAGQTQSLTVGDAFSGSNPGLVITGDVLVMIALAVTVVVAAFWRPVRHGGVLLAGAIIPMAAQAISALVQAGSPPRPPSSGSRTRRPRSSGSRSAPVSRRRSGSTAGSSSWCSSRARGCSSRRSRPSRPARSRRPACGYGPVEAQDEDLAGEPEDEDDKDGLDDSGQAAPAHTAPSPAASSHAGDSSAG